MSLKAILLTGLITGLVFLIVVFHSYIFPSPLERDMVRSPDGSVVLCNRLIVSTAASASPLSILAAIHSTGAVVISTIPQLHTYYLSIPGPCNYDILARGIDILRTTPGVEAAEPDRAAMLQ
jgi:hypothetical protein